MTTEGRFKAPWIDGRQLGKRGISRTQGGNLNEIMKKVLKQIDLEHYGSWQVRGGYGDMKTKTMTVRVDEKLETRIKEFVDHPKNHYWNKGEVIRAALGLYLDTFESQNPKKKKEDK